ncbi:hypothetical protein RJ640_028753 [Escallonia rubra]|uniref:HTH myb-type domain-containing protein n=1 Tax=Escallonia rubra TaxID=112253 RepID=A0AA88UAH6_9ASTE|nr:hypothetical protein RJ640_028753 [Escallonia rubra]
MEGFDFSCENFLDSIDFDDLFVGMEEGDVLPDLEMDAEMLAEFSVSGGEDSVLSFERLEENSRKLLEHDEEEDKLSSEEETVSKRDDESVITVSNPSTKEGEKGRKSSGQSKNHPGKRKVKVDWTPELHRRFVQAVEQLGVDKAVPSRILELMGIDCLTRHNIASHLQKYRSHRKHLLAREAEAASWTQRRHQMYGAAAPASGGGGGSKRDNGPWLASTMGFPPMAPVHHFRPLHVWGHPPLMDQPLLHVWPKHIASSPSPPPPPTWPPPLSPHPPPPPSDPSFWHSHHPRVPNSLTPGTPFFPQPLVPRRFPTPPVPGIPPHAMFKVEPGMVAAPAGQTSPRPPLDFHPSKESIDAAIGDALAKPWQPLPLGLKPPSLDGVMECATVEIPCKFRNPITVVPHACRGTPYTSVTQFKN